VLESDVFAPTVRTTLANGSNNAIQEKPMAAQNQNKPLEAQAALVTGAGLGSALITRGLARPKSRSYLI
jgi:hypothetical protein